MRSDALKRAQAKYEAGKYVVLSAKVKTETAQQFREYAASNGTTTNALLSGFILDCISHNPPNIPR